MFASTWEAAVFDMPMCFRRFALSIFPVAGLISTTLGAHATGAQTTVSAASEPNQKAAALDGAWELAMDKGARSCRVLLRAQQSDNGDYFLGMPPACRHAMPDLERIGRWTMPDSAHLSLNEPVGTRILELAATGDTFSGKHGDHVYELRRAPESGRSAAAFRPGGEDEARGSDTLITRVAKRTKTATAEPPETKSDLSGRYAVMREKRDTGCMLTLDRAPTKGGDRAHLAPGCRDQGIVIFDPSAWQIVKGELVLTARAGHKTHLLKDGEGAWAKDPKDGGKPLGLKRL